MRTVHSFAPHLSTSLHPPLPVLSEKLRMLTIDIDKLEDRINNIDQLKLKTHHSVQP